MEIKHVVMTKAKERRINKGRTETPPAMRAIPVRQFLIRKSREPINGFVGNELTLIG